MDVGELISVAISALPSKESCPFCRPEEKTSHKNELEADFDEDADNNTYNHASTLGKNLADSPHEDRGPLAEIPEGEKAPVHDMEIGTTQKRHWHDWIYDAGLVPVVHGAHHIIPGNAALKKSALYKEGTLGPVDDGTHELNVGYNVNSKNNGIWLPGSYSIRGKKGKSQKTWSKTSDDFQRAYAFGAMADTGRQFHDTHTAYSKVVLKALEDLADLLEDMDQIGCPECGKGSEEDDPPYHIVARLNAISSHIASLLWGDPENWKDNGFASDKFGEEYRDFVKDCGGFVKAKMEIKKMRAKSFKV